jgi:hypothetical protein
MSAAMLNDVGGRSDGVVPSVQAELPVYVLWLVPAGLGAAFGWSWWVPFPLLIPGLVLYNRVCRQAAAARDPGLPRELPREEEILFWTAAALVGMIIIAAVPGRYLTLVAMASWIAAFVPFQRMLWRRVDRAARQALPASRQ